jgi:DNA (cytosine-5)-methyltransferase 1
MRVADFFCGAGGWSEGFRQEGLKVIFALDHWKPAQETHKYNHPEALHPGLDYRIDNGGDILAIDLDDIDSFVPDTEIIVGSPPCVSFSSSNKAGKADKSLGIRLIEKYLQIVAVKKNKPGSILAYWAMENVPNSKDYVKRSYSFKDLGIGQSFLDTNRFGRKEDDVALTIEQDGIFNAADYGTPQTRRRYICGSYPMPKKTHEEHEWVTMAHVLGSLGDPLDHQEGTIKDPTYGFSIRRDTLTDHHYDSRVEVHEWERAKHLKEDHSFMGKMSFPEELERPSRTIMATQSAVSRESILFGTATQHRNDHTSYRLPTIREIASFMSFPITYQFISNNESTKYKLVGNAVCVKQSAAFARAMKTDAGWKVSSDPNPHPVFKAPPVDLTGRERRRKEPPVRRFSSKYRRHIPYQKVRSFRVDLTNTASRFEDQDICWSARIHVGSGKANWKHAEPGLEQAKELLERLEGSREFVESVHEAFRSLDHDPRTLQQAFCREHHGPGPDELLERVGLLIGDHYPSPDWDEVSVPNDDRTIPLERDSIPAPVVAGLYATLYLVSTINRNGNPCAR